MTASHGGARLQLLSPARTNRKPSATLAVKHLFGLLGSDRQMVRLITVQVSPRCTNAFYGLYGHITYPSAAASHGGTTTQQKTAIKAQRGTVDGNFKRLIHAALDARLSLASVTAHY